MRSYRDPELEKETSRRWRKANPARRLLYGARRSAIKRDIFCDLRLEDIEVPTHCPVFGMELTGCDGRMNPSSATLDRIDNLKGYTKGNVIVVSWRANALKKDASIAELRTLADFYDRLAA